MTENKQYWIDVVTPDGELVTDPHADQHPQNSAVDVVPPESYVVEQANSANTEAKVAVSPLIVPSKKRKHMGIKASRTISNTLIYIVLIVMSIVWLIPFVCILIESFRVGQFIYDKDGVCTGVNPSTGQVNYLIPDVWGFDNYVRLFTQTNFPRWFLNTFILGLVVAVIQTIMVLAMSYVLSRLRFKGRKGLMNFMLVLGMFPGFLTLILLYKLLSGWGMTDSGALFGLILVYTASSGMGYYVCKGYFDTIPKSLDEAARVDGATRLQVMFKVILPMAKPIVIYTVLIAFMAPWGDFILARYLSHAAQEGMNVAVGLQNLMATASNKSQYYTAFCAGGVVVAIPITALFLFLQKYYVAGVTGGAVKG